MTHNTRQRVVQAEQSRSAAMQALSATIAHEVRKPISQSKQSLAMIRSGLAVLDRLRLEGRETEYQERLRILEGIADSGLSGMVRGEMLIAIILRNIREERFDPAGFVPLSMAETVRKALDGYAFSRDHQAHLQLDLEHDFSVLGDENLLIFVLLNLLQNALRYVGDRPGGEVRIVLSREATHNRLRLCDNGPGIPPERIAGIFETFGTHGNKQGTGLGLPFCRRVMTALGGQIAAHSSPGAGTEMCLTFPLPGTASVQASGMRTATDPGTVQPD